MSAASRFGCWRPFAPCGRGHLVASPATGKHQATEHEHDGIRNCDASREQRQRGDRNQQQKDLVYLRQHVQTVICKQLIAKSCQFERLVLAGRLSHIRAE